MALNAYLAQTSRLLHDPNNVNYPVGDLTAYINLARGQIAVSSQSVRFLNIVNTVVNQETYAMPTAPGSGVGSALSILGIALPWGTYKPTLTRYTWQDFQSYFRVFSGTVFGFPECYGVQGSGVNQLVYLFPIPQQIFASEWDCTHTVNSLATDSDPEALPFPWTDCVPYYAAYFALLNAQRFQEAKAMYAIYQDLSRNARAGTNPLFTATPYPRTAGDLTS